MPSATIEPADHTVTFGSRREWHDSWRVVAGAAIGMGTGVGLYLVVRSLFVVHLTKEFGWTRGDIGVAGMVAFVTGAVALPIIGRMVDRVGYRRVVLVCVPALALLYVMIALQPGPFRLHLVLMVWGGLFAGGTAAVAYTRPVVAAFARERGLALGLATAGTSLTAIVVPPIIAATIAAYGWRAGLYTMAVITAALGLPLALALIGPEPRRPSTTRRAPSLSRTAPLSIDESPGDDARLRSGGLTLGEAIGSPRFWLLVLAFIAVNFPGAGVVAQLAPLLGDKGLSEESAALVMSIYAAGVLVGRLGAGFSLDRVPTPVVAAAMTLIPAIGISLLRAPSLSFWIAAAAVFMIGLQQGSEVDLIGFIVSRYFGIEHYGAIYGALGVGGALSTATSLVFFGKIHDVTGSYDVALAIGAVAFCIGAVAFAIGTRGSLPARR
jgi:sugar phosphate permease